MSTSSQSHDTFAQTDNDQVANIESEPRQEERLERNLDNTESRTNSGAKLSSIPELLEVVLLHLPVRDLLLAQRVSKSFKATINGSRPLQQSLFFQPEPQPSTLMEDDVRTNPLLIDEKSYSSIPLYGIKHYMPYQMNIGKPLSGNARKLKAICVDNTWVTKQPSGMMGPETVIEFAPTRADTVNWSLSGSWRKMYLTQPPLKVWYHFGLGYCVESSRQGTVLRFGELFPWRTRSMGLGDEKDGAEVDVDEANARGIEVFFAKGDETMIV